MPHRTFDDPNSIEARQALLDGHCERAHPKRHRTKRRSAKKKAAAKRRAAHKIAVNDARYSRLLAEVRAYWSGDREEHP